MPEEDPEDSQEVEEVTHLWKLLQTVIGPSCHGIRRSTSCAVLALNGSVVFSYSRRQNVVSLSSGEAEYYAAASGASEGVYLKNIVQFLTGKPVRLVLRCDSQAARGMIQRQGVQGSVKHMSLKVLWLQDLCQSGILSITAVQTRYNLHWHKVFTSKSCQILAFTVQIFHRKSRLALSSWFAGTSRPVGH